MNHRKVFLMSHKTLFINKGRDTKSLILRNFTNMKSAVDNSRSKFYDLHKVSSNGIKYSICCVKSEVKLSSGGINTYDNGSSGIISEMHLR